MSNRWRPEAKLAEMLYKIARPYLVSLSSRPSLHTPDDSVRDRLCAGEWAEAVTRMLHLGWQPDPRMREAIRRMWILGGEEPDSSSMDAALRFSSWVGREERGEAEKRRDSGRGAGVGTRP
jgi:hypothetical protein